MGSSTARRYRTGAHAPVLPPSRVARARHRPRPPRAGRSDPRDRGRAREPRLARLGAARGAAATRGAAAARAPARVRGARARDERARRGLRHGHAHQPRVATRRRCAPRAAPARWPSRCSTGGERAGFSRAAPARPPRRARHARWASACSRTSRSPRATRSTRSGAERVLVLDWDVHHGNGTNAIFHDSREVLFVSIHQYPFWPGTGPLDDVGEGEGEGYSINLPVPAGHRRGRVPVADRARGRARRARQYRPDLILISAGYDAHRDDPLGGARARDRLVRRACRAACARSGEELGAPVGARARGRLRPATRSPTRWPRRWRRSRREPPAARGRARTRWPSEAAERARPLLGPLNQLRVGAGVALRRAGAACALRRPRASSKRPE